MRSPRRTDIWRMGAALLLAGAAQYTLTARRDLMWDGIILYALAMAVYASATAASGAAGAQTGVGIGRVVRETWEELGRSPVRALLLLAAVAATAYVALKAVTRQADRSFADLTALWAGSLAIGVAVFLRWRWDKSALSRAARGMLQPEPLAVAGLVAATVLLRAIGLADIPPVLSGDEASMGLEALSMIDGTRRNPFITGWLSHPTLYFAVQSVFLRLGDASVVSLRMSSALVSGAAGLWLYLLARRLFGRGTALMALAYYATYHYAIHYGRLGLNNIWDLFWALGGLYLLEIALDRGRALPAALAGLCAGLSLYFYLGARLAPILMVVYTLYRAWQEPGLLSRRATPLALAVLVAVMAGLPLLAFFQQHPEQLTARWRWVGIFPSGWVASQVERTGKSVIAILADQLRKSALAFNATLDPTFWYRPERPLLFFTSAVCFVFGLTHCVLNWRKRACFLPVVWFLLVIVFGGMLLENPPSSPRLVMAIPPVVLMVTLGMREVAERTSALWRRNRVATWAVAWALVLVTTVSSLHFYFGVYTPKRMFSDYNTATADAIGRYLRARGPGTSWYLIGAPRLYVGHATIPFLAQGAKGTDVLQPLVKAGDLSPKTGEVFVVLPERDGELLSLKRFYPSGLLGQQDDERGRPLFYTYELDGR
jgi:4-amino-4-deoxy-L-arabinose transferase-like glycosyltransferase